MDHPQISETITNFCSNDDTSYDNMAGSSSIETLKYEKQLNLPAEKAMKKRERKKHKNSIIDLSDLSSEAQQLQRREKERVERLDRNKKDLGTSIYSPFIVKSTNSAHQDLNLPNDPGNGEPGDTANDTTSQPILDEDDDLIIEEVIQREHKKKTDLHYIELGSSEDEENAPTTSASSSIPFECDAALRANRLSRYNAATYWQYRHAQLEHYQADKQRIKRKRRHSADYDKKEITPEGRVLINADKPKRDPDVFVARHLSHILQPHQIGGVKFMYDNIVETLESFSESEGVGCILAHSMGLGKTIQAITFIELFIRVTSRSRILVICPVNVLQNWNNEFEKWMPKNEPTTGDSIRDWDVFVLGDATKSFESRTQLINDWHEKGGVLLIGYEMFRMLTQHDDDGGGLNTGRRKKAKKQQRIVFDLEENLARMSDEDKHKLVQKEEQRRAIKEALLSPGPDLVICDEGHRIKNLNTDVANALSQINTKRRVVLTGYPLQNNLMEYYCMVEFVRPSYLGTKKDFMLMFEKPIRNGQCIDSTKQDLKMAQQRIHVLTNLLRGFVQRRSQHLLKKILPESREYVLLLRKSPVQHALYRAFHHYANAQVHSGELSLNPLRGFAICMKIVNHPDLLYDAVKKRKADTNKNELDEKNELIEEKKSSTTTNNNLISPEYHQKQTSSASNWLNNQRATNHQEDERPRIYKNFQIPSGPYPIQSSNHSQFQQQSQEYLSQPHPWYHSDTTNWQMNNNNGTGQPSQQCQLFPNLYTNTQSHQRDYPLTGSNEFFQPINGSQIPQQLIPQPPPPHFLHQNFPPFQSNINNRGEPTETYQRQFFTNFGYNGFGDNTKDIFKGTFLDDENEDKKSNQLIENGGREVKIEEESIKKSEEQKSSQHKVKKKLREVNDLLSDEFLFEDVSISLEWVEPLLKNYVIGILENSSKLFVAMQIIIETVRRGEKLLLFSQSVITLNQIESFLKKQSTIGPDGKEFNFCRNKTYCRFDGTTSGSDREKLIKRFNEDSQLQLFLISTKAGSLGVNLVSANRVIIFDVSWNPCHDAQAICRIYRYGQKRKTFIYRLIMGNSMEKQVFNRQISKQGLQKRVIDEQMIDANVTTREVQNLMEYNEALDVISTSTSQQLALDDDHDDDLLMNLVKCNSRWFFEAPFLHESMMLEREEGLSQEEKYEAELLYEREKRGINFPPSLHNTSTPMQFEIEAMSRRRMGLPSHYPLDRLSQTTPLPKNLELASDVQKPMQIQQGQQMEIMDQQRQQMHEPIITITKQITLPKVVAAEGDVPYYTLYSGQQVKLFNSSRGIYLRTFDGFILDATKSQFPSGHFFKTSLTTPKSIDSNEVIQIDD